MGLGKTPTVLAHLARTASRGTSLVIAPAAVVGNWAAEAARFAPDLRVRRAPRRRAGQRLAAREGDRRGRRRRSRPTPPPCATSTRWPPHEWATLVLDEAQAIKNPASDTAQQLRRIPARTRLALTGTPIENGVGDLWAILDFTNPGLVGPRPAFVAQMSGDGETALRALNGILLFRRTKSEPEVAAELPDKIDELDHCTMTAEQIGLYQAVLDDLVAKARRSWSTGARARARSWPRSRRSSRSATTPPPTTTTDSPLTGRSGKLTRLEELVESRVRRRRAGPDLHPLRHLGTPPGRPPHRGHRPADRVLRRRPHPDRARPDGRRVPEHGRVRGRWCSR